MMEDENNNNVDSEVFVYTEGVFAEHRVVRARVHPSVNTIRSYAFHYRNKLEVIDLCEGSVETIGSFAFCGAPLHNLHLPDSVESIGDCAFCHGRFPNV